ncbi:MAG: YegS/Rv2252/BmrU family lipid kinase [Anaerolineae bacterium]|nr:YegS/Rv2252/BmrU family lipid kinase [Anaerolineae bacterium]
MSWIPVIINPAAGRRTPVLAELNQVFRPAGVRWSVEITQAEGDGVRLARKLAEQGAEIVAAYGGDGTISEVATGLAGSGTALAVLPGGTGNVIAYEFGIPQDLTAAARLAVSEHGVRLVDLGEVGDRTFMIRVGVGLEAAAIDRTPRGLKDRFGLLAYGIGGLQALIESRPMEYRLELDGEIHQTQGVICTVANAGAWGWPGLRLSPRIDIEDGLLDVFVFRRVDLGLIAQFISENVGGTLSLGDLQHWQVRQARIEVEPPQAVQVDGDQMGVTPVELRSRPRSLRVLVPQ